MVKRGGNSAIAGKARRRASVLEKVKIHNKDIALLALAAAWLCLAWLLIDLLPFKLYRKMMRPPIGKPLLQRDAALAFTKRVSWAVGAAARRVPWRAVCFHQGLATHQMLCRAGVPTVMHFGVAKSIDKGLDAHVWVTANGRIVSGEQAQDRFTVLGVFTGIDTSVK
jgi:hypothetical protein